MTPVGLQHPLLSACGVAHGFGLRHTPEPQGLVRPRQVHGRAVAELDAAGALRPVEADAVVSRLPGRPVGVVTADCVPILLASRCGGAVAAIHAGWRGLAAGVIPEAVARLRDVAGDDLVAVIGPHIGPQAYEVDVTVIDALRARYRSRLDVALAPTRPGHARLDLGILTREALWSAGLAADAVGAIADACTHGDPDRFHSYRRDGEKAGRLCHWVAAGARRQA